MKAWVDLNASELDWNERLRMIAAIFRGNIVRLETEKLSILGGFDWAAKPIEPVPTEFTFYDQPIRMRD